MTVKKQTKVTKPVTPAKPVATKKPTIKSLQEELSKVQTDNVLLTSSLNEAIENTDKALADLKEQYKLVDELRKYIKQLESRSITAQILFKLSSPFR